MLSPSSVFPVLFRYSFVSVGDTITRVLPSLLMKEDEVISFQFNVSDVQVVVAAFHEAVEVGSASVPYPMNPRFGISRSVNV